MTPLRAEGFPEQEVRLRARSGPAAAFPPAPDYGSAVFGQPPGSGSGDWLDHLRLAPPVFTPERLGKLIELGREPSYHDVTLDSDVGGLRSALPLYVSAFGSTDAAAGLGVAVARQAGQLGVPMVVGENIAAKDGYRGHRTSDGARSLMRRVKAYQDAEERAWAASWCSKAPRTLTPNCGTASTATPARRASSTQDGSGSSSS